ncbi:MAG: multidrug ABC transporter [Butyrivibrio sp.]|nr:multidrug ABC transporter [Butyrivibrio sp.]
MDIRYALILAFGTFIASLSQVLLKKEAAVSHDSFLKEYLNPRVIIAYAVFFISTFMSILAYKGIPLSFGPIIEATGYIYIVLWGKLIFKEHIGTKKLISLGLILAGIAIYAIWN